MLDREKKIKTFSLIMLNLNLLPLMRLTKIITHSLLTIVMLRFEMADISTLKVLENLEMLLLKTEVLIESIS